ncbi:MAG: cytochrome C [Isosphaeraceae bacterium]|nr:cytochrome C [Isosphaeraceae bacterium]
MERARRCVVWIAWVLGFGLAPGAALLAQVPAESVAIIGNRGSKVYHRSTCGALKRTSAKNKVSFSSTVEAETQGYKPCGICHPDASASPAVRSAFAPKGKTTAKKKGVAAATPKPIEAASKGLAADDGKIRFARDIAPIFVGNCIGCHNPQDKARRGQFDLSTFAGLMAGGKGGAVIIPGKPEESRLVLRIKHEGDEPKMPQGDRNLSEEACAKIAAWVKAGARLDAGLDPTEAITKYAPTAEERRKAELARLSPEQRDQKIEQVARERWRKASSKTVPEMTSDKHFLLFSTLPADRAKRLLKTLEDQAAALRSLLGPAKVPALEGPEKVSLYVFSDANAYAEFIRGVENREFDLNSGEAHGRFDLEFPYLAAVDPLGGRNEPAVSARPKTSTRGKRAEEELTGSERTLAGLLVEQLAASALGQAGQPPRWLALGIGAFLAEQVEHRNHPYYRRLRAEAAEQYALGWPAKAGEALNGEGDPKTIRALGFSLVEWLAALGKPTLSGFSRAMLAGPDKLDDVIRAGWGPAATRDQFLGAWGRFVASRYGSQGR